jgi:hypothetical protein
MSQRKPPAGPPRITGRTRLLPAVLAALLLPAPAGAQEQKPLFVPPQVLPEQLAGLTEGVSSTPGAGPWCLLSTLWAGTHPNVDAWSLRGPMSSRAGRNQVGAATLFLGGFQADPRGWATGSLATLLAGHETGADCWTLLDTDQLQPFPEALLDGRIHDRKPLSRPSEADIQEARLSHRWKDGRILGPIRDGKSIYVGDEEAQAFSQVLVLANYNSARAFRRAARHDLSYANLFNEPEKYRGEVVHLRGRLLRLIRFSPPLDAAGMGVNDYFEAWIINDGNGNNPYCAVCVELPPGLQPAEKIRGVEVAFDGYFYKRFRYKAADSVRPNEYRDAPLLIGHGLTVLGGTASEEERPAQTWGHDLMKVFVGAIIAVLAGIIGLTFWFRYADRRVHRRLRAAREADLVLPEPDREPTEPGA